MILRFRGQPSGCVSNNRALHVGLTKFVAVALTGPLKLGGLVVASGYMPLSSQIKEAGGLLDPKLVLTLAQMTSAHAVETPVFWAHGKDDPLIPYR